MAGLIHFSEAVNLGLHALRLLAATPAAARDNRRLAADLGVSANHLSKVLQRLQRAGLVASTRGPAGGFRLVQAPQDVSLLNVYEALEGPLVHRSCLLSRPHCLAGGCVFGSLLADTTRAFEQQLRRTTLATVTPPKRSSRIKPKKSGKGIAALQNAATP